MLALDLNGLETDELPGSSSPDGLTLFVDSGLVVGGGGDRDVYVATRTAVGDPFTSREFTELNAESSDGAASATAAGTTVMFESNRSGTVALWEAVQAGARWDLHFHVELDSSVVDGTPWLSPDGTVVVFSSNRVGGTDDLYMATR